MNFINRAIKYVTRKISKSILLLLTFFLIGNLVIIGLGVSEASKSAKVLTRQKMRAVVTYELDYQAIEEYVSSIEDEDERNDFYSKNYPRVSLADVNELLKDERVKTANCLITRTVYQADENLDFVHLGNRAEEDFKTEQVDRYGGGEYYYESPMYIVKGNFFPDMIEFSDNDYVIESGRFYTQEEIDNYENVILVSKAFAELNGLSIGDTIRFGVESKSYIHNYPDAGFEEEDFAIECEIIGIFTHKNIITPDNSNFDYMYPYENYDNMFLMPATTFNAATVVIEQKIFEYYKNIGMDSEYYENEDNYPTLEKLNELYIDGCTLLLNDPLEVDNFVKEYEPNLEQFKKLNANNDEFNKLSKPLDTLSLYANFIVWLVIINAIVIITLVTALTLKTREYEIGVLLSIGATKFKIIVQFFLELAVVAVVGFTLAVGSGSLISNKVGEKVLDYQIASSDIEENDDYYYSGIWSTDYTTDLSMDDLVAEYNVSISPILIIEIYVLGLAIVFVSVIIPSFMIMRFNPKKILMNQG